MVRLDALFAPVISVFKTIQSAVYKIGTVYGDSNSTFRSPRTTRFQGVGQGNGCDPTIWAAVRAHIIQMLYTAGFGLTFVSAVSGALVVVACVAFVDDTDVIHSQTNASGKEM
jgi:hypothetical protein